MKQHKLNLILWVTVLLVSTLACNYVDNLTSSDPSGDEDMDGLPTPNLTLTAVFAPTPTYTTIPPSPTITPTEAPTATPTREPVVVGESEDGDSEPVPTRLPEEMGFESAPDEDTENVSAVFLSAQPVIDGDFSDWTAYMYTANNPVFGEGYYSGPDDVRANFKVAWDTDYLYIGVQVFDNKFVQIDSGQLLFLGDSIEILFNQDLLGDIDAEELNDDDFQIGLSPGNRLEDGSTEAYLWYPKSQAGSLSAVKVGALGGSEEYWVEAAIPWSLLDVTPEFGQIYGFSLSVSDNDTADGSGQQTMVSNLEGRTLDNPATWGELTLIIR
ncbi:MAG: hypothetical protein JXB38_19085 [Anaerolineales bacterium]|nr:hypothetical protein [Anaerolineales bacterium]